jgi:hypothetical protein
MSALPPTSGPDPSNSPAIEPLVLRRSEIGQRLGEMAAHLERTFIGAHQVLQDATNEDRLALSAHGFREAMKDLARYLPDVPTHESLGDKVRSLIQSWPGVVPDRDTPVSSRVRRFLLRFDGFVAWHSQHQPNQDAIARAILAGLARDGSALPDPLHHELALRWRTCLGYFTKVAHHIPDVDEAEFRGHLEFLEETLHAYLVPKPFVRLAELDRLIEEGEADAI